MIIRWEIQMESDWLDAKRSFNNLNRKKILQL